MVSGSTYIKTNTDTDKIQLTFVPKKGRTIFKTQNSNRPYF